MDSGRILWCCFSSQLKKSGVGVVRWIAGSDNDSDMFSNNLDAPLFERFTPAYTGVGISTPRLVSREGVRRHAQSCGSHELRGPCGTKTLQRFDENRTFDGSRIFQCKVLTSVRLILALTDQP